MLRSFISCTVPPLSTVAIRTFSMRRWVELNEAVGLEDESDVLAQLDGPALDRAAMTIAVQHGRRPSCSTRQARRSRSRASSCPSPTDRLASHDLRRGRSSRESPKRTCVRASPSPHQYFTPCAEIAISLHIGRAMARVACDDLRGRWRRRWRHPGRRSCVCGPPGVVCGHRDDSPARFDVDRGCWPGPARRPGQTSSRLAVDMATAGLPLPGVTATVDCGTWKL